jgi:hypothetical protein
VTSPLSELLRDAAEFIEARTRVPEAFLPPETRRDFCVGCGAGLGSEPAHDLDCPVAKLLERLGAAREEVDRAMAARLEKKLRSLGPADVLNPDFSPFAASFPAPGTPPDVIPGLRRDPTPGSPGVAKVPATRVPLRFRLVLDPATRRARFEPGDEATAAWLASNRDVFLAEQKRSLAAASLEGDLTEELVARLEQTFLGVVRVIDPRAAPVVVRYRPANPPR